MKTTDLKKNEISASDYWLIAQLMISTYVDKSEFVAYQTLKSIFPGDLEKLTESVSKLTARNYIWKEGEYLRVADNLTDRYSVCIKITKDRGKRTNIEKYIEERKK